MGLKIGRITTHVEPHLQIFKNLEDSFEDFEDNLENESLQISTDRATDS